MKNSITLKRPVALESAGLIAMYKPGRLRRRGHTPTQTYCSSKEVLESLVCQSTHSTYNQGNQHSTAWLHPVSYGKSPRTSAGLFLCSQVRISFTILPEV